MVNIDLLGITVLLRQTKRPNEFSPELLSKQVQTLLFLSELLLIFS